jgi:Putative peptidoglycan binding domain
MKRFVCILFFISASVFPARRAFADHHDHHDWHGHDWRDHHYGHSRTFIGVGIGGPFYSDPWYYDSPYYAPYYYEPPAPRVYTAHRYESLEMDVQLALTRRGYYRGTIDGDIGPASRAAIRAFQRDHGLPVTGHIDDPLLRALRV